MIKNPKKLKWQKITILIVVLALIVAAAIVSYKISLSKSTVTDDNAAEPIPTGNVTTAKPTKPQIVCLDPGHGGKDTGAIYRNVTEADLNLKVALQVRDILQNDGYKVYMTRTDDSFVYKRPRARYCNSVNASIMIDIHHNSYETSTQTDYSTALYYKDSDQALAANILDAISAKLKTRNQGIAKFDDSELYIATMPAALSEGFFITSKSEYEQIIQNNSPRLSAEASGIVTGIENYFASPTKPADTTSNDSLILDRTDYGN